MKKNTYNKKIYIFTANIFTAKFLLLMGAFFGFHIKPAVERAAIEEVVENIVATSKTKRNTLDHQQQKALDAQLFNAAYDRDLLKIIQLIEQGASVNAQNQKGETPLIIAVFPETTMEYVKQASGIKAKGKEFAKVVKRKLTPFFMERSRAKIVRTLLLLKADSNIPDNKSNTALIYAVIGNDLDTVRELLAANEDQAKQARAANFQNKDGEAALMYAVWGNHIDIVHALLEAGANTDLQDKKGNTALMLAVLENHIDIVRALLKADANTDIQNIHGETALMVAAHINHIDIVRALLKAGAKTDLRDKKERTALVYAVYSKSLPMVRELLQKSTDTVIRSKEERTVLMHAVFSQSLPIVDYLLKKGAVIDAQDKEGKTALMYAVDSKSDSESREKLLPIVCRLIDKHADTGIQDSKGNTALMIAARINWYEIVAKLLKAGASKSINIKNNEGKTALMILIESNNYSDYIGTALLLIRNGADIDIKDQEGKTAVDYVHWLVRPFAKDMFKKAKEEFETRAGAYAKR